MLRRMTFPAALALCCLAATLLAVPQKHPSVASGVPETSAKQLHSMLGHEGRVLVLDVRTPQEYGKSHIPESVNVPLAVLRRKVQQMHVSKDTTIVTTCDHGGRSSRAALELQKMGYHATSFCRIEAWQKDGYKITRGNAKSNSE
jgi:rhodanese-related sulfurtransferase